MNSIRKPSAHRRYVLVVSACLAGTVISHAASAQGTREGVQAQPGEIVLLRNVAARPADRQGSPGMALLVDPSPRTTLNSALGADELSDTDYSNLGAGSSGNGRMASAGDSIKGSLTNALGGGGDSTATGNGINNATGAPLGSIGDATRGIGGQVSAAVAQLPLIPAAAPGGH